VVTILRGKDAPFQVIEEEDADEHEEEEVINHFKMHMKNQSFDSVSLKMSLPEEWEERDVEIITQDKIINLDAGKDVTIHFFVKFPRDVTGKSGTQSIKLNFIDTRSKKIKTEEDLNLVGPKSI
ncbi:MAG: hypothetical protein F9K51_08345, partial [Candidatus Dadabacteria bacterium]